MNNLTLSLQVTPAMDAGETLNDERPVKVAFMMWGQECETQCSGEQEALRWLSVCSGKGWLMAKEITTMDGVVLHEGIELTRRVDS